MRPLRGEWESMVEVQLCAISARPPLLVHHLLLQIMLCQQIGLLLLYKLLVRRLVDAVRLFLNSPRSRFLLRVLILVHLVSATTLFRGTPPLHTPA